jgi:hypothetical protein
MNLTYSLAGLLRALGENEMTIQTIICGSLLMLSACISSAQSARKTELCMDGFCIGQSIRDPRFEQMTWILPKEGFTKKACTGIGCRPEVAFRGYNSDEQKQLGEFLSWSYGLAEYNIITNANLGALRRYRYECNPSPRGINGERRFFGAYLSAPSKFLTVVGLRLIGNELRIYRIARQYPFHNQAELEALGAKIHDQYGNDIVFYDGVTSNAYSDVIEQKQEGWFGRSTMFNPSDLADNAAEFVLIDPRTRPLLEPSSMPESGEISPLANRMPQECSTSIPLR